MRSKIAKRILDETPQEIKDKVKEYIDNLVNMKTKETYGRAQGYYQDGSLESLRNEKKHLEGLIFAWRRKIQEECNKMIYLEFSNIKDDKEMFEMYNEPLKEFDEHFGIVTQRHGEI